MFQVNTFGANNPLTNLVPDLKEVDPDDAFSSVPYEKGFALLYHLEELLGGPGKPAHTHTHCPYSCSFSSLMSQCLCFLRGVHGIRQVLHPDVRLQQCHHRGVEELPVHLLQGQGIHHLPHLHTLTASVGDKT